MSDIKLEDVRLAYTEDPYQRRLEVLRTASLDVRANKMGGRVAMIAKKIDAVLSKKQKVEKWEAHMTVLALDHLVEAYCNEIYEMGAQLDEDELEAK